MDIKYVRQRRAKKIITIAGTASTALVTVIAVIAILAQRPGAFVVSLDNSGAKLTLSETPTDDRQITYMNAGEVPSFVEYEDSQLSTYGDALLDNENFDYRANASTHEGSIKFFSTTFYVKNVGKYSAGYALSLNFTSVTKSVLNGYELSSILRVRFYENKVTEGEQTHNYRVFAKPSGVNSHIDENGEVSFNEVISKEGSGYAEPFESQYSVLKSEINHVQPNEMYRYTFVMWLEGNDPECVGEAPVDSKINLGVTIVAHEEEE